MALVMHGIAAWPAGRTWRWWDRRLAGFMPPMWHRPCGCKAVLLNPAVDPARDLAKYIGEQTTWHDPNERFYFEPRFVDELRAHRGGPVAQPVSLLCRDRQGRRGAGLARNDRRYPGARIKLLEGSDHALSDFDDHIDEVFAFHGPGLT
jgi:predicted esterase YcpF (UPF0227 family)